MAGDELALWDGAQRFARLHDGIWHDCPPQALAQASRRQPLRLLLDAPDLLLAAPALPRLRGQRLAQALPFALEDDLADEPARLAFAAGTRAADGRVPVAWTRHERLADWHHQLATFGIRAAALHPAAALLDPPAAGWALAGGVDAVWLRQSDGSGGHVAPDALPALLAVAPPERVSWHGRAEAMPAALRAPDLPEVEVHPFPATTLVARAAAAPALTAPQAARTSAGADLRAWLPAAVLATAALLLITAGAVRDYRALAAENARLDAEMRETLRSALPQLQRIVDPRAQLEQALAARSAAVQPGRDALYTLSRLGPALAAADIDLRGIQLDSGGARLDLRVPELSAVEELRERVARDLGRAPEILSATAEDDAMRVRLALAPEGS